MKVLFLAIIVNIISFVVYSNPIDSIETKEDVLRFLAEKTGIKFKYKQVFDTTIADTGKFGKNKFFKTDIDGNGLTDLLVNGNNLFAVTDIGNNKYKIHLIDNASLTRRRYTLKDIIYDNGQVLIVISPHSGLPFSGIDIQKYDTLIYKFDCFIEYNPFPKKYLIDRVEFSTSRCMGTCPVFEMTIDKKMNAKFIAKEFNQKSGSFKTVLDTASFNHLMNLICYIDFPLLDYMYSVDWEEDQTANLTIYYDVNKVIKIIDYGLVGTFGLEKLYDVFFEMRKKQQWK